MKHSAVTGQVIGSAFEVHRELGAGFLEQVYENAFAICLRDRGLRVEQQRGIDVRFRSHIVGEYRADLLVESVVFGEVKAQSALTTQHEAQLLNCLRATGIQVGWLPNFGKTVEYRRRVYG
jgi:GxxExxY protein